MTDLAIRQDSNLMPALSLDEAAHRYNMVVEYTKKMMTKDKDYGVIPGTGKKPTLLKPGAEKLCSLFGMVPEFETLTEIADFEKGLFFYRVKCTLYRNGEPVASGIGSCNSKEKKYRYRYVYENKASEEEKAKAISVETKDGRYGKYKVYKVENSEPFELVNTIDKMAQKRALVAATLIGANASEFFTQDIEDMGFVDGDFSDIEEPTQTQRPKTADEKNAPILEELGYSPKPKADLQKRPYAPETLREALKVKAATYGDYPASDKQRNFLAMLLSEYYGGDDARRHTVQQWLLGVASTKDADGALVKAALDWLNPQPNPDGSGGKVVDEVSEGELSQVYDAAIKAEGQETLI